MAYYDDVPLDFDTQEQQLLQQAARIKALRGVAAQPITAPGESTGWNSAVTGTHIGGQTLKTPTAALLQPLIANLGSDFQETQMNRGRTALNASEQQDALTKQAAMGDAPSQADAIASQTNPILKAAMQKRYEDQLVEAPKREATRQVEILKLTQQAREAEANRKNALEAARIKAAGGGPRLTMIQDDNGNVTGGYDPKTNTTHPLGSLPGGIGSIDTSQPAATPAQIAGAQPGSAPPASGVQPIVPNAVQGKKSPAVLKAEAELRTKVEEGNDVLGLIEQARGALKDTTYGYGDSLKEGITGFMGKAPDQKILSAQQLDQIAGNLAAKYPRGPGSITDTERLLFVKYMGDVNNRLIAPSVRMEKLGLVEDMIRKSVKNAQGAQAGGGIAPPAGAVSKIGGQAEFDALPSGARFAGPDGVTRVKP